MSLIKVPHKSLRSIWVILALAGLAACTLPWARPATPTSPPVPTLGISPASDKFTPTPAQTIQLPTQTALPAATLTATATLAPSPTPNPAYPLMGIELSSFTPQALDLTAQAGARWVRRNALLWSVVEPQEGQRNWAALADLEKELAEADARGLETILVVQSTPGWAQKAPGYLCGPVKADKLPAFANFMRDVVARYSQPPYSVLYWELGNEPDIDPGLVAPDSLFGCWGDYADPYYGGGYYAEMLKQVYPQVKAGNAQAQVMVGGLLADCDPVNPPQGRDCTPSRFLEGILGAGGGDFFDGVSFHAYDYYQPPFGYAGPNWNSSWNVTGPVAISKSRYLRSVLSAAGYEAKFLMNTEVGLLCGSSGEEPECQSVEFDLTKAYYVAQSNASALASGLRANIWYSLLGWRGSSLVNSNMEPLNAYKAYQASAQQLSGAVYAREVTDFTGVRVYEFSKSDQLLWILWSLDGAEHPLQLPGAPSGILDVFGTPVPISQQVTIGIAPVYLQWAP